MYAYVLVMFVCVDLSLGSDSTLFEKKIGQFLLSYSKSEGLSQLGHDRLQNPLA